ncbi:MAG TPA: hypothetical protein PLW23_02170, partial [Bacteroidales bacterium]|nr:hypothetical protein [Bacteroidales bacterium]
FFLILTLVGLALLGFSSCSNECTCKTYINGDLKSEYTFEKDEGRKCKDYNSKVELLGQKTEVKCR